jgi:hypothetical protein
MARKKIKTSSTPAPCGHKKTEKIAWGIYRCATCGEQLDPNLRPEYRLSERVLIESGDLIKVKGVGLGIFLYASVNTPSGIDNITFAALDGGRWHSVRTVYPDRVKRAPKKAAAR